MSPLSEEEVIARYDRFLLEFIEALDVCPYARGARLAGRVDRAVLRGPADVVACVAALQRLTGGSPVTLDVGVLILPDLDLAPEPFMRHVTQVREAFTRVSDPPGGYYLVAMHPDLHEDLSVPSRAVGFMRRTPHPTIQVARASVVDAARGGDRAGQGETTSARVARLGLENVRKFGTDRARALLEDIRAGRKR